MVKLLLGGAFAAAALGGAAYYVSDYAVPDLDTPPVLAQLGAADAYARLAAAPFPSELAELDDADRLQKAGVEVRKSSEPGKALAWTIVVEDVPYATVRALFASSGAKRTTIDVQVAIHDSPFTSNGKLHPFDIKLLEALLDLGITDYAASIVEGRPPRSWNALGDRRLAQLHIDENEKRAMGRRLDSALASVTLPIRMRSHGDVAAAFDEAARAIDEATEGAAEAAESASESADASGRAADEHNIWRGRPIDPRETMRQGVQPSTSAQPMVEVGR
jgi:hypothetical protein